VGEVSWLHYLELSMIEVLLVFGFLVEGVFLGFECGLGQGQGVWDCLDVWRHL